MNLAVDGGGVCFSGENGGDWGERKPAAKQWGNDLKRSRSWIISTV
jgi:hypothetical protein